MGQSKNKLLLTVAVIIIASYVIEAVLYALFSANTSSVAASLLMDVPLNQVVSRLIMLVCIVITALLVKSSGALEAVMMVPKNDKVNSEPENFRMLQKLISDMRIPMNSISGFTELLKDPQVDKLTAKSYLHNISTSSRFAVELIDMLEDIYRINTKTLEFNRDRFDLNSSLEELALFMEEKKSEMGASFVVLKKIKGVKGPFNIEADRKRLELILSNLIENSLKYTKRGFITFGYEFENQGSLSFFIKDTGKSPNQERIDYILNSSKDNLNITEFPFDSYALKLVYANRIISLLGGSMTVTVFPVEETEYRFSIPLHADAGQAQSQVVEMTATEDVPTEIPQEQPVFEHSVILIAEDNSSNFILLQELLMPYKTELIWAKNGEEAVQMFTQRKDQINLVLMDILMPKMDGYEAARLIKELKPDMPVIAQTAYSIENVKDKKVLKNFDGYLIKPIWSINLKEIILSYLKA